MQGKLGGGGWRRGQAAVEWVQCEVKGSMGAEQMEEVSGSGGAR